MYYSKDTTETLYHFDDNKEFTHVSSMMIRKNTGLPAQCTLLPLPEYDSVNERCYFINEQWQKSELFVGRQFWNEEAVLDNIQTFLQKMPERYSIIKPPKAEKGFVVRLVDNMWVQLEDHSGTPIFKMADCQKSKLVIELGPIEAGWTNTVPLTPWDEWIDDAWVTNQSKKYIADYDAVDSKRRALYREMSDPLYMESYRKKENGEFEEAAIFKTQADAAVKNIQVNNPFPPPLVN
ncbi:hypothetical protein [Vibrio scophthalmi]|uniref:Uncharacterized protein n=1 Tax=Vibrio scophthalmi LMG 19158 TaxID=870967 RepID=F9RLU5_9VIBR|nr:hypothetical protein [Vibrio scophthalmi]EGU38645.1 hypothetical protein VIS19158_02510 [Vibrio scophthalmi LMG 19158]